MAFKVQRIENFLKYPNSGKKPEKNQIESQKVAFIFILNNWQEVLMHEADSTYHNLEKNILFRT